MTVIAEQAQPGRRYKTPRGSICTVEAVPAEGQVRLNMEGGGTISVPRAYPLQPVEPPATGGTDLALVAGKAPAVVEAALPGLTLAELDDLADRDPRMFVLELVDRERKRRATPEATGVDHDEVPVPDRDEATAAAEQGLAVVEVPTSAPCPTCSTEQPLVPSSKQAGAFVFRPHASPAAAYCAGSAQVYQPPSTTTATAAPEPGPFGDVLDAEGRITAVQRMTSQEQIAAARAVPGVQASVVRELDRQQAALAWVLEADGDMAALQARAGAHRLENRPGCLAVVRELIARLRGLGVDPEPSVQPARPRGDHPDQVDATSDYAGEHAGLARRLRLLTGRDVWAWADLEAVAAMTGTVRASRAALRATGDHHLVRAAWLAERTGDNRDTVLGQLASRYSSLGCDASTLPTDPVLASPSTPPQPGPEVPVRELEAVADDQAPEGEAEHDPNDSVPYWHGIEDFAADVPIDQPPGYYDEEQAREWVTGWRDAEATEVLRQAREAGDGRPTAFMDGHDGKPCDYDAASLEAALWRKGREDFDTLVREGVLRPVPPEVQAEPEVQPEREAQAEPLAPVEQVDPPRLARREPPPANRSPLDAPRPHDVLRLTRRDGLAELWVVTGYRSPMNAIGGEGHVSVLVLTEHGDHPELRRSHGSSTRSGTTSWWAAIGSAGEPFEVVQTAVPDPEHPGAFVPPADGYDYSLPPGSMNARGFPRAPDELLPTPWRNPAPVAPEAPVAGELEVGEPWERLAAPTGLARPRPGRPQLGAGDQVVLAEHDAEGREVRRMVADVVTTDDNGALGLRWAEGRRTRDRRFSRHTGIAIGHGNGKAGLRILGRLARTEAAPAPEPQPAPAPELPHELEARLEALPELAGVKVTAHDGRVLLVGAEPDQVGIARHAAGDAWSGWAFEADEPEPEPTPAPAPAPELEVRRLHTDDRSLPFAEQVARASLGRARELIVPDASQVRPDAQELVDALAAERAASAREAVVALLEAELVKVRRELADQPFEVEVSRLDRDEALRLVAEHQRIDHADPAAARREAQAALALEARVHNRDEVIEALTAYLAATASPSSVAPPAPPPAPPARPAPAPTVQGEAAAAAARAAGKVAVRMDDLRVIEHRRGPPELWAFPEGELPQRLGHVDAPHLAAHVAALREAGTDGAPVLPWRPVARRAPEPTPAPAPAAPPAPSSPLGALGEALGALKALGLRVDLRITSDDVKG